MFGNFKAANQGNRGETRYNSVDRYTFTFVEMSTY